MTQYSDERGAELRELFFESAQELLQSLNDEALNLEKQPGDAETVRSIRRIVHTVKGDAAACGFRELSEIAHELEDVLGAESALSQAALPEVAFTAADTFSALLTAYREKTRLPGLEKLRKMMRDLSAQPGSKKRTKKKASSATRTRAVWTEYEHLAMSNAAEGGKSVYHVVGRIDPSCAMPIAARQMVLNALSSLGDVLGARPETGSAESTAWMEFLFASDSAPEQITAKCRIPTVVAQLRVDLLKSASKRPKAADSLPSAEQTVKAGSVGEINHQPERLDEIAPAVPTASPSRPENVLRVDADRIDSVLNLVGELIIGKSMLQQAFHELSIEYPKSSIRARFADAMSFQARILNDLQRSVMKIRMVPVDQLFRRFPRVVRDVAKQCGKQVELIITGQDTDLDKSILDAISEPLTHIVRNAVSHGIEAPEARIKCGKIAKGTIRLNAYHHGNQVIVEVSDDGRGIDPKRVQAKALENGLITSENLGRMSEPELLDLIFRPGFSTAEEITEVSGRGVGLDVVKSVLQRLKGSVHIETRLGHGTTFRLKLPLTLAIIKALLFRVERRLYAIPLNTVAEISRGKESDVHQVDNYEVLQLRNDVLPVIRLGERGVDRIGSDCKIFVLVVNVGERKFGLIVDALEGEEELVIKALDDQTVATDMVSGASILGDGRVVLILNIAAVVERFSHLRPDALGKVAAGLLSHRASEGLSGIEEVRS